MRTLFIGGTRRGLTALQGLVQAGADLVGIISLTQDDHETDRCERHLRALAESWSVPLYETRCLNDRDYAALIAAELRPEIAFVVGCRRLLDRSVYELPPHGTLAVHDSLLPEYRGFAPVNWAILNGESHTGVTLFYLNDHMDGGDIVASREVPIGPDDYAATVYRRICDATADLLRETYPLLARDRAGRRVQDPQRGSRTCKRVPADGLIDWNHPALVIYNQVRALSDPFPGAHTFYRGRMLWVWRAERLGDVPQFSGRVPGRVVAIDRSGGTADVLTADGLLRLSEVQLAGQERLPPAAVFRSLGDTLGLRTADLLQRIERLEAQLAEVRAAGACHRVIA